MYVIISVFWRIVGNVMIKNVNRDSTLHEKYLKKNYKNDDFLSDMSTEFLVSGKNNNYNNEKKRIR